MELDDFSTYRVMCTNRIQRLERYKKARSFCNLEEGVSAEEASTSEKRLSEVPRSSSPFCPTEDPHSEGEKFYDKENTSYEVIREKMMELVENDMAILQQLMNLGDQVAAMRKKGLRRSQSTNSMERAEEDDEFDEFDEPPFSASMSAVTNLVVDDSQPQYFSRQNSVLRIPIQPRRSNRFGSKRVPRRPSDIIRTGQRSLRVTTDESSSESSDGPVSPLSHAPSSVSSKSSVTYSSSSASEAGKKSRSSNSSIDSGIRDSSDSPSPVFERQI